jgi:uncharacterized membrane protein YeaQ/YmgE (transglycosylase-associated protein family)
MTLTKLLVIPGGMLMVIGGLAGWLLNQFDASGAVGGVVFILLVSFAGLVGSVVADRLPPSHPPR